MQLEIGGTDPSTMLLIQIAKLSVHESLYRYLHSIRRVYDIRLDADEEQLSMTIRISSISLCYGIVFFN